MDWIAEANLGASSALLARLVERGVRHLVLSPGSRSTPLALAAAELAARGRLQLHVHLDERSAAFVGLGIGLATNYPAVVVCTSGTAAANYAPAVIEAGLSAVPLIVVTADRPPELRHRGAPQTIEQRGLYGDSVRWSVDLTPPDEADSGLWSTTADTAIEQSLAGPVHLNMPFREPLVGGAFDVSTQLESSGSAIGMSSEDEIGPFVGDGRSRLVAEAVAELRPPTSPLPTGLASAGRGVIIAGGRSLVDPAEVGALAERLGWPIIADPLSGVRQHPNAVTAADPLLRCEAFADAHTPDLVIRVGRPLSSKVVGQWIAAADPPIIQVGGPGRIDPDRNVTAYCDLASLAGLSGSTNTPWMARWRRQNQLAEAAIAEVLAGESELSEPHVARIVAEQLQPDDRLIVSSSMPVRDLEWYGGPSARALANRGANGIDGVVSTGLGVALTGVPARVLIGDLAAVHDANALVGARQRRVDLTVVVNDNNGGGIFSFLPQSKYLGEPLFEELFGTPTSTDIAALAAAHGVDVVDVSDRHQLEAQLAIRDRSIRLVRVPGDRRRNVEAHRQLNEAVAAAVS